MSIEYGSTIVVFGSARIPPPDPATDQALTRRGATSHGIDDGSQPTGEAPARRGAYSRYYDEARRFAQIVSTRFQEPPGATSSSSPAADPASWRRQTAARTMSTDAASHSTSRS